MKSFLQRHSGTHKPTSDPTPKNYQVWLPPALEPNEDRTRYRTAREPLNSIVDVRGAGERRGPSHTHQITEVYSVPHVASSGYDYTTYPSTGGGYHGPTHTQATSTAFASVATPSDLDLNGSAGWSTSQRHPALVRPPPVQDTPMVYREDHAQRPRRSDDRHRDADKRGEREHRTRERDADIGRYKARVTERSSQKKDYIQHRDRDEDRRRILDDERERRDRRRSRERRKRDKEKESESDRDRDRERERERERERNERRERGRIHAKEMEYREAHRERERDKDRNLIRGRPEGYADRDSARNPRRERERNQPGEQEKEILDRKGKTRERDEELGNLAGGHGLKVKDTGRYGTDGKSEVPNDLREGHPYVTRPREMENGHRRHHDRVRETGQREHRRDDRQDNNYLDRRFEPGNADWNSASIHNFQQKIQHRSTPVHDETNSDSSPCKDLPKLSKHKRNFTDVEAPHLTTTKKRDPVPLAPSAPELAYLRQATFASNSRENQAGYGNIRVDPTPSAASSGEIGRSMHKERKAGSQSVPAFLPAPSTEVMYNDVQLLKPNAGQLKYDEVSNSLSSQWPFSENRSNSGPSPLVDNTTSTERNENQKLEEQSDHTIIIPKTVYSSASRQAVLREAGTFGSSKYPTRTVERHSKPHTTDAPQVGSSRYPAVMHSIPSVVPAMTDVQPSTVRASRMESHWYRPEETPASRIAGLQMSDALTATSSRVHEQIQVPFPHGGRVRAPSDAPPVDNSRKRTESTGSKDQTLIAAHSIHESPKLPYHAVPSDDYPSRTTTSNRVLCQVEPKAQEVAGGIASQSRDTLLSVPNHIRNTPSTPAVVGIKGSIAQSLAVPAVPPSMRQTFAQGRSTVQGDGSLQSHSVTEPNGSQGASSSSAIPNNVTDHKVTQQAPIRPMALPNIQLSKPTDLLLSQQGQTEPSSIEITSTQPYTPITLKHMSSGEYLPQNVCQTRTHKRLSDNASHPQTQTSHFYRSLQDLSPDQDSKSCVPPISTQSSLAIALNENADHPQNYSTDILEQGNQALSINMVDQAPNQTCTARTHDQPLRHLEVSESGTTRSRAHFIVQQRTTELNGEAVHNEDMSDAPGGSIEVNIMTNKISSQSPFIPSSNESRYQVHSSSNQAVHHVDGLAGSLLETSSHVKTRAFSSDVPTPETVVKNINLLESERPRGLEIDSCAYMKAGDIGEVHSVRGPITDSIGFPPDSMHSDGPSRYRSSTESLAQPFRDGKGQVVPRNLPVLKTSAPKLIAEYKASSIPNQPRPPAALQILRPSTAIGHPQIGGEESILLSKLVRDVPNGDKTLASTIQRPATAMSSRHRRSERPINDMTQAPAVQSRPFVHLQSYSTEASDALAPVQNPAISSTQPTNKSDVTPPVDIEVISPKHIRTELQSTSNHRPEDKLRKMQLQPYPNTLGPELGLTVAKKEVPTLGIDGAPVGQVSQGDGAVVQHHMTHDSTLASIRGDKNAASSGQYQPKESVIHAIAAPQGDQPPIQNAKLAELLSNPVPFYQHISPTEMINDLQNPREVISRPSATSSGAEQPATQLTQSEAASSNQKIRGSPERYPHEVDSRVPTVQKRTRAPEQFQPSQNHINPPRAMLVSTSQQSTPGCNQIIPLAESTAQLRTHQDFLAGSKSQKLVTSRNGNHAFLSSVVPGSQQETQTHLHTNPRHHKQSRAPHKATGELNLKTQPLPVDDTSPPSISVRPTQTSGRHQTPSERAVQSKDQKKTSHKHTHLLHSAPVHTGVPPNSLAYNDSPATVLTAHPSNHQQSRGVPSTWDHNQHKSSHKVAVASSSNYIAPSNTSRSHAPSTQRTEPPRHRGHIDPINDPSGSQTDVIPNRHVQPSSSQIPQSSLQTDVSQSVSSSVKPRTTFQSDEKTSMRSITTIYPSESPLDQSGASSVDSKSRTYAPTNTFQSRSDTTLQQSIPASSHLPVPPPSRRNREVSRRPSEDSVLLKTPSSLAPTILKPSTSRTSIPTSFSSQTSSRKRGLLSIFRSKSTQPPDQAEESQKSAPRKLRKESKIRAGNLSETAPPQNTKVTSAMTSRAKAPPIAVPIPIPPVAERKSPNKVFTPFRYLTTKRNRRVSQASLEAQDGTAPNTIIGSPTASVHSTQPPPIQPPPLRDVFAATQEWRHLEAAEVREVTGGRLRRARPGVVFDVAEDHTEEDRPKIRPQSRQS
ncbi:hypothetical protein H2248_009543 [Termitomyces sp. 'cryptogamus']|nr:hypothetical protein H2248_009543 [Termitomyces sp. 'cryptogamus']